MGIVIDSSSPVVATSTQVTTTASFTPPDGSMLLIAFSGNNDDWPQFPTVPTITDNLGSPLTYTIWDWQVGGAAGASASGRASTGHEGQTAFWTANVISSAPMTVTVTNNTTFGQSQNAVKIWVLTGVDLADPVGAHGFSGSTSGTTVNQAYTAQVDGGQGFLAVSDWNAVGTETAGTGCTFDVGKGDSGSIGAPDVSFGFCHRTTDDDANGVTNNLRMTLPSTSTSYNWSYIEIQPGASDPAEKDPPSVINFYAPGGLGPNGNPSPWLGTADEAPPQTGIIIHQTTPKLVTNTVGTGTALTTETFKPADNSLILVMWAGNSIDPTIPSTPTISDNLGGGALTYTLSDWQSRADSPTVDGQAAIWTAPVTTGAAMTITVNNNAASPNRHAGLQVVVLTHSSGGRPTLGAHGKSGSTSTNIIAQTYTAQATGGQGFVVYSDWSAVGAPREGTGCFPAVGSEKSGNGSFGTIPTQMSFGMYKRLIPDDVNTVANRLNVSLLLTSNSLNWAYLEITPPTVTTQNVTPTGISGEELYGSTSLQPGSVTATQTSVQSDGNLGNATVATAITVSQTGTGSEERVGSAIVSNVSSVSATGIQSSERTGITTVTSSITITQTGIGFEERNGTSSTTNVSSIFATGISSSENVGEPAVSSTATVPAVGIASAEASGSSRIDLRITAASIGSAEAIGEPSALNVTAINAASISTEERFGAVTVTSTATIAVSGISTNESVGAASVQLAQTVAVVGIASQEREGNATLTPGAVTANATGISSEAQTGTPTTTSIATIAATGISSEQTNGALQILLAQNVNAAGILSAQIAGASRVDQTVQATGSQTQEASGSGSTVLFVSATGIASDSQFGSAGILLAQSVFVSGIASAQVLGSPSLQPGPVSVLATGIPSAEAIGNISTAAPSIVSATGITTSETFGKPSIVSATTISAAGILSADGVGSPGLLSITTIQAQGITSAQVLGQINLAMLIRATGVSSLETFGRISIVVGNVTISAYGIASATRFGRFIVTAPPVVAPPADTTIILAESKTKIKIVPGETILEIDESMSKIKVINGFTEVMLDEGTIVAID